MSVRLSETPAGLRLGLSVGVGLVAALLIPRPPHLHWEFHALVGWCAGALAFLLIAASVIFRVDGERTRALATREDDSRAASSLIILSGSIFSLAGVIYAMSQASELQQAHHGVEAGVLTGLGVGVVVLSWVLIQTVYTFRYAHLYFADPEGGIEFDHSGDSEEVQRQPPDYLDFWYLAVTIGMTFQVSDTNLSRRTIRRALTNHALTSYAYNAVLVALTINFIAGLIG